jgi:acylphosphatase
MSRKTVHVYIRGKVQGVWFRANTKEQAEKLNVQGWVRNMRDGRVEALFEGDTESVNEMVEWCHHGPYMANVKDVRVQELNETVKCTDFKIKS